MNFQDIKLTFLNNAQRINDHLAQLQFIIEQSNEKLEGNCFYEHQSLNFRTELLPKQVNLFWAAQQVKNRRICEIGFNAGHSMLLFLIANPEIEEVFIFDLNAHQYTEPCYKYIHSSFPTVKINFLIGDSKETLSSFTHQYPQYLEQFDLVHIDGGHLEDCVKNDILYGEKLVSVNGLLIIDDTNVKYINAKVNTLLESGNYIEMNIFPTTLYSHRILKRIA